MTSSGLEEFYIAVIKKLEQLILMCNTIFAELDSLVKICNAIKLCLIYSISIFSLYTLNRSSK